VKKDTVIYGIVFFALAAFIFFFQTPKNKKQQGKKIANKQLFKYDEDKVVKLNIISKGKETVCEKDSGGVWHVVLPEKTLADETEVYNVINIFTTTPLMRVVDESPHSLTMYGLDSPSISVSLGLGGSSIGIKLGSKNPSGSGVYAMEEGKGAVLLLPSYVPGTLDKDFWIMRNKYVFSFLMEEPVLLEWQNGTSRVSLKREKKTWKLVQPETADVDYERVSALLKSIRFLSVTNFLDDASSTESGLDMPECTMVLTGEKSKRETLIIGKKYPKTSGFYGKRKNKNGFFVISEEDRQNIFPTFSDLKKKEKISNTKER